MAAQRGVYAVLRHGALLLGKPERLMHVYHALGIPEAAYQVGVSVHHIGVALIGRHVAEAARPERHAPALEHGGREQRHARAVRVYSPDHLAHAVHIGPRPLLGVGVVYAVVYAIQHHHPVGSRQIERAVYAAQRARAREGMVGFAKAAHGLGGHARVDDAHAAARAPERQVDKRYEPAVIRYAVAHEQHGPVLHAVVHRAASLLEKGVRRYRALGAGGLVHGQPGAVIQLPVLARLVFALARKAVHIP